MTMIAKIWPSPLPHMRAKAISARLRGVEHQLEAEQDHERVAAREHAGGADRRRSARETTRYQSMFTSRPPRRTRPSGSGSPPPEPSSSGSRVLRPPTASAIVPMPGGQPEVHDRDAVGLVGADAAAPAREHDGADGGDQQQERGDLERQQELRQQQLADLLGAAEAGAARSAPVGVDAPSGPSRASRCASSTNSASAEERPRARAGRGRPARRSVRGLGAADVGDDEDVEHHHRAGVDDDLRGGDELRLAAAGTAPPARAGGRRARARCRTGCAARRRPMAPHDGADAPR